jgi:hypothetical protein
MICTGMPLGVAKVRISIVKRKSLYHRFFPGLSSVTEEWSWLEWTMFPIAMVTLIAPISELVRDVLVYLGLLVQL